MKIFFAVLLMAVVHGLSSPAPVQFQVESVNPKLPSDVGLWWGKDKAKSPVAIWFHGGMTSGNCQKGLVAGDDLAKLVPNYTVVSVSACRNSHWVTPAASQWVDAALDSIAKRRNVSVDSVYLVGISDGALGVLAYSAWGRRGQVARVLISANGQALGRAENLAMQLAAKKGGWRFIQGGMDRLYPADVTVPWIETFCKNVGAECDLKFDPAGEHDWKYWQNKRKDWILEIFSKKPLTKKR